MKFTVPSNWKNGLSLQLFKQKYASASPMAKRMAIMVSSLLLLFILIFGFKLFEGFMMAKYMSANIPISTVSAIEAKYDRWQPKLKATGSLRPVEGVDVTNELAGIVKVIYVKGGETVKQGDLLTELRAESDIAQLHSLEALAEVAKTTYIRNKAQYAIHAISKAVLDQNAADLKSKEAQAAQQAAIVQKKFIHAPFSGRLGIVVINTGQYLNSGSKIVTLQQLNPIYVDFFIPQQNLVQLKVGQPIKLTTDSYPNQIFMGKISTIDPIVDESTRNVGVEATLDNPKFQLLPGMFGSVEIDTGAPQYYLTLPQTAVNYNSYGDIVFILKPSHKKGKTTYIAKQTFVTVGPTRGDQVAILKGIKIGDLVVVAGQLKLKNNSEVVINNSVMPSNTPSPHLSNE